MAASSQHYALAVLLDNWRRVQHLENLVSFVFAVQIRPLRIVRVTPTRHGACSDTAMGPHVICFYLLYDVVGHSSPVLATPVVSNIPNEPIAR
jgi:hypothetical protein